MMLLKPTHKFDIACIIKVEKKKRNTLTMKGSRPESSCGLFMSLLAFFFFFGRGFGRNHLAMSQQFNCTQFWSQCCFSVYVFV